MNELEVRRERREEKREQGKDDQADRQYLCWIFRLCVCVRVCVVCGVRCVKVRSGVADWVMRKERLS